MATLSEKLRKFRESTGQSAEPAPKEEAGVEEGDLIGDYVMPIASLNRRILSKVAEKGAQELAKGAAKKTGETAVQQVAKESAKELADIAKKQGAKDFLGKIEIEAKPMPGEAPFKGQVPQPAGQKVGANKPEIAEGPALDYAEILKADRLKRAKKNVPVAEEISYSRMSSPTVKERIK